MQAPEISVFQFRVDLPKSGPAYKGQVVNPQHKTQHEQQHGVQAMYISAFYISGSVIDFQSPGAEMVFNSL